MAQNKKLFISIRLFYIVSFRLSQTHRNQNMSRMSEENSITKGDGFSRTQKNSPYRERRNLTECD